MSDILQLSAGPSESRSSRIASLPHVLLVVDGFPQSLGGGERIVLRLATLLPQYGYRVSILALAMHPESSFQPADSPCPLYLLPLDKSYDLAALSGALSLRRFLKDQNVSIVQTFFESSDLWAGCVTRALSSARLIWSRRDMGILRGRKHSVAYRILRRLPHAVFAVSEEVRQHVVNVDGIAPGRVQTIYNGLDLEPVDTIQPKHPRPRLVVTVGNVRRVKGHDLLIQAAAEVVRCCPEAVFKVAGEVLEPEYFSELQSLITNLGLNEHFHFVGKVADTSGYLSQSEIFVLPSRSEGFSNALIEAMANRLPVVATAVGGNAEAIDDGVNGLIVPPEDPGALADAILRLLAAPEWARRLGDEGRSTVEARFSAGAMMAKIASQYDQLLSA